MSVAERVRAGSPVRRWTGLAGAAVVWFALYAVNGRFWMWLVGHVAGLDLTSRLSSGVLFFVTDSVKIVLLLVGIIFVVTVLRSFMSVERTRALLGGRREGVGNVMAAGLGVVTPFCSCSAVPAFIGFVAAGVPIGVTLSFLIASPLVNEVAIAMLFGMFGVGPTALYVVAGLVIAVVAGFTLGRLHVERWVEPFVFETRLRGQVVDPSIGLSWDDRIQMGLEEVRTILRRIWPYLLVGIGLGAAIHGWAPADLFTRYAGAGNPFAVLVAVALGVPLYSNAAGVMPLVQALHDKGLPMGTLLAFMMAVVALSLPELILLRRVLKPPLIAAFVAVTALGIVAVGYLFNAVLPA
ncbi:permease [Cellulomonas sp. NTE-D12]|uniref:permease n=1 Tax=Cellulomonas sp. NTE-D12 TaxID=2962632 RepID=UPI003081C32A|nr:permease [Cellulomonas sp. NTE-D12]